MIAIDELEFTYRGNDSPDLRVESLSVAAGEIVEVRGPNGRGKTTLVRLLTGLAPKVFAGTMTGRMTLGDFELPHDRPGELLNVVAGVLDSPRSQVSGLKQTVFGELAFPLENRGWKPARIRQRVDELLDAFGLDSLSGRSPFSLSGGERQRMILAAALAAPVSCLVLDEPDLHLDPVMRRELFGLLGRLADEGMAILVTTHASSDEWPDIPRETITLPGGSRRPEAGGGGRVGHEPKVTTWPCPGGHRDGPVLDFQGVSFSYVSDDLILRDVDLRLEGGDGIAIVGPNGSGKTTLAKLALGLLEPDAGRVVTPESEAPHRAPHLNARHVGLVFQDPDDQLFRSTVRAELSVAPASRDLTPAVVAAAIEECAVRLDLFDVLDENPLDLSWSRRRLTSIAAIAAGSPRLLILDEPTSGLDDAQREAVEALIADWTERDGAVLAISHDHNWVREQFSRCYSLVEGQLVPVARVEH